MYISAPTAFVLWVLFFEVSKMKKFKKIISYVLVAVLSSFATVGLLMFAPVNGAASKLDQLSALIEERFIGDTDVTAMQDAAADAMVRSLGDRWSYYISAEDFGSYQDQMSNSYVGVGITIHLREDGYLDIMQVTEGGPAEAAGILAGDILVKADGQDCAEIGIEQTQSVVRGEEGTVVSLTVRREDQELNMDVTRAYFETPVVKSQMLDGNIGYIKILNFDSRCAEETIAAIEARISEGAESLLFDVRNNPGGYKHELCDVLDYLLPEGPLFRSERYDGTTDVDESDADFLDIPMAVMVNAESYSAAEFFAAALREYGVAQIIGQKTVGKGYFQETYQLSDGSAVGLSVGKYFTPDGVSLAETGLEPDVPVEVDEETFAEIYYGTMNPEEDPQILAAINVLKSGNQP